MFESVRRVLRLLTIAVGTAAAWAPGPLGAATVPWPDSSYAYYAKQEALRDALATFGKAFGVNTEISKAVSGTINGRLFADTPSAFLDQLATAYGLQWFYHGGTLHVSAAAESVSESIEMTSEDIPALRAALEGLGVFNARFGWGELPDRGVVIVSGPPAYVNLVRRTLATLPVTRSKGMSISVFRLKHASVDDRTFFYRDRQVVVPGVATILRNIVTNQSYAATGVRTDPISTISVPSVSAAPGAGLSSGRSAPPKADGPAPDTPDRLTAPAEAPVIQADTRLNAVIVKDLAERMASYRDLVELLDVPTALIEIEAAVIDVNTTKLAELGIRWQGQADNVAGGFGAVRSALPENGELALGIAKNASLQTILSGTGAFFLAKVAALERTGDATVLSRPSVLTLDNLEAVLDLSETFYIKLEGERVADLQQVTAGVLLRVTPRLVESAGTRRVKMAVDVEDGAILQEDRIADLPTVRRSTISTQAIVNEYDSLLIGGYYFEEKVKSRQKIPVLGDLPVLGLLFSEREDTAQKRERLFMITPRVIEMPSGDTPGRAPQ